MIFAKFLLHEKKLVGFEISGHSSFAERGKDIICAAVSSCAYMVTNTVTDIYHIKAEIKNEDGFLSLSVPFSQSEALQPLFEGFRLHLKALAGDCKDYLKVRNVSIKK